MNNLIDGRRIAEEYHAATGVRAAALAARGVQPRLAFVRVGEDPASKVYVGMKEKKAAALGILSDTHVLPLGTTQTQLLALLDALNRDATVHGILVQAPLPPPMDAAVIYSSVDPAKDVDGFHPQNLGRLVLGDEGGFLPCTPAGVHELLLKSGVKLSGADVVVLGRGNIVGKPMANMLLQKSPRANCTVTIVHSASRDIARRCREADILVAAMGSAEFVRAPMVKPGAVVIDVGVNRVTGADGVSKLVGDVAFAEVQPIAGLITPNPGGVGPMTIAMLMANTVTAAERATR
jgi:methylenetetrahydrofolate dehydrogenase (NADP+) / methenyltetrahydrofolate cyclohydrolase